MTAWSTTWRSCAADATHPQADARCVHAACRQDPGVETDQEPHPRIHQARLVAVHRKVGIKTILACLNVAVKDGLIKENPVKDIEKPAWERREHILTGEELDKLFAAAREPFQTLLRAMADSGCRPQEICDLQVEDCFPDDSVWLVANKTKNKTGVKKRPIYLTPELADLTRKLMAGRTEGHLFLNRYGDAVDDGHRAAAVRAAAEETRAVRWRDTLRHAAPLRLGRDQPAEDGQPRRRPADGPFRHQDAPEDLFPGGYRGHGRGDEEGDGAGVAATWTVIRRDVSSFFAVAPSLCSND